MDHLAIAHELRSNKEVFRHLFAGVSRQQYLWRPQPEKWCLLEILCHLYDEEREDFRARTKSALEDPQRPWEKIDPKAWVTERNYMEQDYNQVLEDFLREREASVEWLTSLDKPKWDNAYQHPKVGPVPASLLLNNWLAHDYLHFRQITATKYFYLKEHCTDKMDYAGDW